MPNDLSDRIGSYLRELAESLRSRGLSETRIVDEARAHLIDLVDAGVRRGLTRDAAERDAIAAFGEATTVAAAAASARGFDLHRSALLTRILAAACVCTLLATSCLALSVVILRPPRLNYHLWSLMAGVFVAQSLTTLGAVAGWLRGATMRVVLASGGSLIAATGAWWVNETLSAAHFEGYALVLGTWVAIQGLLTVLVVMPTRGRGPVARSSQS